MMQQPDSRIPLVSAASLAADICHGDRKAFELFYRMEYDNLVHFASHYLHDRLLDKDGKILALNAERPSSAGVTELIENAIK